MGKMPDTVQDSDNYLNTSALLTKWELVPSNWNHSSHVLSPTVWGTGCHPVFRLETRLTPTQLDTKGKSM